MALVPTRPNPTQTNPTQTNPTKEFNILMVGETGVGKSTFINAFMNYMTFKTLDDAVDSDDIVSLIPSSFTVTNDNFDEQKITYGTDTNESTKVGASATQSARSYKVPVGNAVIRIIDTPGIGDTRGIGKDEDNFDKLLTMIGELEELHAICILLKPNNARLTVLFEYCVKQLLSRLQKSASRNITFVFTNSRSTFYRPGDTLTPLKKILGEIKDNPPNVVIPFGKANVFCMDNEAFRFLVAKKNGVEFSEQEKEDFSISWDKSADVCIKLIEYVTRATPHKIKDTVSVNEARRLILRLSEPLAHVTETIDKNIILLERHRLELNDTNKSIDELKKKLYMPVIRLKVIDLKEPRTVCTDGSCTETYKIGEGVKNVHYKTRCHDPCYLRDVPKEIVGSPLLIHCAAMDGNKNCKNCRHSYLVHMHIYYITEPYDDKIIDTNIQKNIKQKENINEELKKFISDIEARKSKYAEEKDIIQKSMAKFAHFLKNNAIAAYNDKYKDYIDYLINREEGLGPKADKNLIKSYKDLIKKYEEHKHILDVSLAKEKLVNADVVAAVSASEVLNIVKELYKLELTGKEIKVFYETQKEIIKNELLTKTEKIYKPIAISSKALGFFGTVASWFMPKPPTSKPKQLALPSAM